MYKGINYQELFERMSHPCDGCGYECYGSCQKYWDYRKVERAIERNDEDAVFDMADYVDEYREDWM